MFLDSDDKADIVMRYIDEVELELVNNKYRVKLVNFRTIFYKEFKDLFDKGYIDWKRKITHSFKGIGIDSKVRYSEYLPFKEVYRHLMRLNECYDVSFYKGTLYKKEINKSLKHINEDMEKSAEEFYTTKKEKDDDLSL